MLSFQEIYESLKYPNSKMVQGELTIEGFTPDMYEDLYYTILESLEPYIKGNYEEWYTKKARSHHKRKARSRNTFDFYDPQYEKHVWDQTIREQLVVLKFFCQHKVHSKYQPKI